MGGSVVRPGDGGYPVARQLFNPRFDGIAPSAIVYCATASDVQLCVAFARAHGLPIAPRSGGHSYAGYSTSTGLVCDVTRIDGATVGRDGTTVIGGGARLVDVYSALAAHGVTIPAGTCPTVGLAGLTLGGGNGVVARKFGLTCDSLTQVQVVTAAGEILTCDSSRNSDLFWACRGGGGGNFGIVTSFTFATHPAVPLTLFEYRWPWAAAAEVIAGWQGWIAGMPPELWSNCAALSSGKPGLPAITVGGAFVGGQSGLAPWLRSLVAAVGTAPVDTSAGTHGYLDAMLIYAGCGGPSVASCHLPSQNPRGIVQREASMGRSDVILRPLSAEAIAVIVEGVAQRQRNPAATTVAGVAFDALGGVVNQVPPDATAFVHRDALCIAQYNATWPGDAGSDVVSSNIEGLDALYQGMRPFASGYAYQNYIDPGLANWPHAYYGSNLARLMEVKRTYDPGGLFSFPQSIPMA